MSIRVIFLIIFFLSGAKSYSQFLISGEGIMDVKVGADWDEVEWELGFKGKKIEKRDAEMDLILLAQETGVDFDFVVHYQHIMWLPVSDLFFKDDKICMIQLSSYPEYYKMLCADIGTTEGLNFWDNIDRVNDIYGLKTDLKSEEKAYIVLNERGLGVELLNNEVRTMFIFHPQMK